MKPTSNDHFTGYAKVIERLVVSYEQAPSVTAAKAFIASMRRHGAEVLDVDGIPGLHKVHEIVCGAGDKRSEQRAAILDTAWKGLPGWGHEHHVGE